ncbi:DUF2169 family type VI secretion system accessory protein [Candidatus Methylocalor cossyra]|uniref:DUF2169 domain-containing protein n=1 Tax=Candidatus Methylocalor cossyra TaxID=3108543 RepID=A0ABM9NMT8_9GAMM
MDLGASPAQAFRVVAGTTETGRAIFSVLVKRTYDIKPDRVAVRADEVQPIHETDCYYERGDPDSSTIEYESDLSPYKLQTDVVLIGKAHAPAGRPVEQMSVGIEVAGRRKVLLITGDRRCRFRQGSSPLFTDPVPFTEMAIRYERAYGGKDHLSVSGLEFHYPRNPLGKGLALKNIREVIEGLELPNIEDPSDLLLPERVILGEPERWNRQPLPQGFGWYQRTWYPRCSFVGAVPGFVDPDEVMREEILGLVPQRQIALARQFKLPSFDVRFNHGASLGLGFPYLQGGEPIRLANLTPGGGIFSFRLPDERPKIMLDIGLGEKELESVLHTVCIRMETRQVDLVWRGAHEYPGVDWLPKMTRMVAEIH